MLLIIRVLIMKSILALILLIAACASPAPTGVPEDAVGAEPIAGEAQTRFLIETVAKDLEVPWGIAFLPDGSLMFTERPGRVRLIENGKLRPEPVFTVPSGQSEPASGRDTAPQPVSRASPSTAAGVLKGRRFFGSVPTARGARG